MPASPLLIRPATFADRHQAIVELRDYERLRHQTRLSGEQVADAYLDWMLRQVEAHEAVLIAQLNGSFAGFVAGWFEQTNNLAETADSNRFGPISKVCAMPAFRGQRIAVQLLHLATPASAACASTPWRRTRRPRRATRSPALSL